MTVHIAPSVLAADFGRLAEEMAMCEAGGADFIHVDVMDGRFVPTISYGSKMVQVARRSTKLPIDVHLMVVEPERYFEEFVQAGADIITIHAEVAPHLDRQINRIQELGVRAGVAVNPGTSLSAVEEVAHIIDLLLIMSVNPGFGGQKFIENSIDKIARSRRMLEAAGNDALLEVDGGIARDTIQRCFEAGADMFVAGNAIFSAMQPQEEIAALRALCIETE